MVLNEKKLAIGSVIYQPEKAFFDRIKLINQNQISLFIYDNSPESSSSLKCINSLANITYLTAGKNQGLGVALARLCQSAYQQGFDALLFFDQDTDFNLQTISFIQNYFHSHPNFSKAYSVIVFSGGEVSCLKDVNLAINSGSLFFLKNVKKIGWHNETYFVDGVDYEFCFKSHLAGLKIAKYSGVPYFDHESEQPDKVSVIFGKRFLFRKYSKERISDSIRSYLRLLYSAFKLVDLKFFCIFLRSLTIYLFGQLLARLS